MKCFVVDWASHLCDSPVILENVGFSPKRVVLCNRLEMSEQGNVFIPCSVGQTFGESESQVLIM